jgi:NADPH:quinone reductase-like Zn-dependent oxidoreductase
MQQIASLLQEQILIPHISKSYTLPDIAAAHCQIESGRTIGKIVISV